MKKQKYRFTLQFDKNNIDHQKVVEILNNQGKKKSQYIVAAVLSYIKASDKQVLSEADINYIAEILTKKINKNNTEVKSLKTEDNNVLLETMSMFGI